MKLPDGFAGNKMTFLSGTTGKSKLFVGLTSILIVSMLMGAGLYFYPRLSVSDRIYTDTESLPFTEVGLVFGAGYMYDGKYGKLYAVTKDRVSTSVKLYKEGKIKRVLMSGDNSNQKYDEPTAMMAEAIKQGVPPEHIRRDFGGRNTYDSCLRAKEIWQLNSLVCITQAYHLPRALFICTEIGIDAVGVAADLSLGRVEGYYNNSFLYKLREIPATWKAWFNVKILHPDSAILGDTEDIYESNSK